MLYPAELWAHHGEGGIRTPGTRLGVQLLSREPDSAALAPLHAVTFHRGEGGIRTPGELPHNGFQDRRLRPLGHSSAIFQCLDGTEK